MAAKKKMEQSQLVGLIATKPQLFAWFLGAGASYSAGLPTASDLLWLMKRTYYNREESQNISVQDLQSPAVRARIQSFMLSKGFPAEWSPDEYSTYFLKIFGERRDRQAEYIRQRLSEDHVTLNVGQRVLGGLIATGHCRVAFTTNFDTVIEKSVAEVSGRTLAPFHLEGSSAATAALNNEEYPVVCKLHGDFRYESIKNLSVDLATQNANLSSCLVNAAGRFGFVVTGYSGRDASVMELFHKALDQPNPFPHGLYWTHIKGSEPIAAVTSLLAEAKAKGVAAEAVEIETYDSLMLRIWRNLDGIPPKIDAQVKKAKLTSATIPLPGTGTEAPLMRLNALPVLRLPEKCLTLSLCKPFEWADLRAAQRDAESRSILAKADSVVGWGTELDIQTTFKSNLTKIDERALPADLSLPQNLIFKGLCDDAVGAALARERPLLTRSQRSHAVLIADRHTRDLGALTPLTKSVGAIGGTIAGLFTEPTDEFPEAEQVAWSECLRISLTQKDGRTWLLLDPDVWIWPTRARRSAQDFLDQRRGGRFNNRFNELLDAWIEVIFATSDKNIEASFSAYDGLASAFNPHFTLGNRTAFAWRHVA
jgi:hypothetical protein